MRVVYSCGVWEGCSGAVVGWFSFSLWSTACLDLNCCHCFITMQMVTSSCQLFSLFLFDYHTVVLNGYQLFSVVFKRCQWFAVVLNGTHWFSVVFNVSQLLQDSLVPRPSPSFPSLAVQ